MKWNLLPIDEFERHSEEWQEIVDDRYQSHPLLHVDFVGPAIRYFGGAGTRLAVCKSGGQVRSMAILSAVGRLGWQTFSPSQIPMHLIVTRQDSLAESLASLSREISRLHLTFSLIDYDPAYGPADIVEDVRSELLVKARTMSIEVTDHFENYWSERRKKLRDNIGRYQRRVQSSGAESRVIAVSAPGAMTENVAKYGELESAGWKGRQNTAIHASNAQGRFYSEVMSKFAERGDAALLHLSFDDTHVASRMAIFGGPLAVFLKTTYHEAYGKFAPGRLMLLHALEHMWTREMLDTIEFYTNASADQLQWSTHSRETYNVNFYRHYFARRLVAKVRAARKRMAPSRP